MPTPTPSSGRPKVLVVVGTRPEAIKMAPVLAALSRRDTLLETRLALTGQHSALVDQVLETFRLEPDYDLDVMQEGQDLYDLAFSCLDGLRAVVRDFEPDLLLIQGDTATVFYAALVAFLEKTRVGHVEAGLRSGEKWSPYPEEIFRRLSDVLTDFHFAPTPAALENLEGEGFAADQMFVTGNTVVDALRQMAATSREPENAQLRAVLESGKPLALLTAHRRESFGEPLKAVFGAVREVVDRVPDLQILFPVHPNPWVSGPAKQLLAGHSRIHLTEPLGYLDLVMALSRASLVLTDSGGIQEEAPTFGVPVLVLREVTERPEGVEAGVAQLVGTDGPRILQAALELLARRGVGGGEVTRGVGLSSPETPNPYGDGLAGERIADIITSALTGSPRETVDWDGA